MMGECSLLGSPQHTDRHAHTHTLFLPVLLLAALLAVAACLFLSSPFLWCYLGGATIMDEYDEVLPSFSCPQTSAAASACLSCEQTGGVDCRAHCPCPVSSSTSSSLGRGSSSGRGGWMWLASFFGGWLG